MNPLENVKAESVWLINHRTVMIRVNLSHFPHMAVQSAIEQGMDYYTKLHPGIHEWQARTASGYLEVIVAGNLNPLAMSKFV